MRVRNTPLHRRSQPREFFLLTECWEHLSHRPIQLRVTRPTKNPWLWTPISPFQQYRPIDLPLRIKGCGHPFFPTGQLRAPQGLRVEDALRLCRVLYLKTDRLSSGEGVVVDLVALALQKPADLGLCPLDLWLCTPHVPNSGLRNLALVPAQPLGVCPHCASRPCLFFSLYPNLPSHPMLFGVA